MKKVCKTNMIENVLFILLFALIINIGGCTGNTTFSGSRSINDNQFLLDFDVLNTTVNSKMQLLKGDVIEVTIDIIKGDVDIIVENENGLVAYCGNDVASCNFNIEIEEAGTYTFNVKGSKAQGSTYFIKL